LARTARAWDAGGYAWRRAEPKQTLEVRREEGTAMAGVADELIERGLTAWADGELDVLETVLDPDVTLRWVAPGEWDCVGRDQVMRLLRQRQAEGNRAYPVRVERVDEHTFLVSSTKPIDFDGPQPFPVATRVSVADG
jgi:hypothetical protein